MSGLYDANNLGYLVTGANLGTGSYSINSSGRGSFSFPSLQVNANSYIPALNATLYVLDSSSALLLETDSSQLSTGTIQLQNPSNGSSTAQLSAARPRFSVVNPMLAAHGSIRLKR